MGTAGERPVPPDGGVLADLLAPAAAPERFLCDSWERRALLSRAPPQDGPPAWMRALLEAVDGAPRAGEGMTVHPLCRAASAPGARDDVRLVRVAEGTEMDERAGEGAAWSAGDLQRLFDAGHTLLLARAGRHFPRLGALVAALGEELGLPANASVYTRMLHVF